MHPRVCNPMVSITLHVTLGPLPVILANVPDDLNNLVTERHVNQAQLWAIFLTYLPSTRRPPYTVPSGWIWVWHKAHEEVIWEVVSLR